MPNTAGFQVVAQLASASLLKVLQAAYDQQTIPSSINLSPGATTDPVPVSDGVIKIPKEGLGLLMSPSDNGLTIVLKTDVQIQLKNPAVPSLTLLDIKAGIYATAPLAVPPDKKQVHLMLTQMARDKVKVGLTGEDHVTPIRAAIVREFLHQKYKDKSIPHEFRQDNVAVASLTGTLWFDFFDDETKPNYRITVTQPAPNKVKALIPVHLRVNVTGGKAPSPIGVLAKIAITADLITTPGSIVANFAGASEVGVENYRAAPATEAGIDYDGEGANYAKAKAMMGGALESALKSQIILRGVAIAQSGNMNVAFPAVEDIEKLIGDRAHEKLKARDLALWTPKEDPERPLLDIAPKALWEALAIGINGLGAGDPNLIGNLILPGRSCAMGLSAAAARTMFDEQLKKKRLTSEFLPRVLETNDMDEQPEHQVRLKSLSYSFENGAIKFEGEAEAISVIFGEDVPVEFTLKIGLEWKAPTDEPDKQVISPITISKEIELDSPFLDALEWLVGLFTAFITVSLLNGVIAFVVLKITESIAESIGGDLIKDPISGKLKGIGAWPEKLLGTGTVKSKFENPILIDPSGLTIFDEFLVTATFADTVRALAQANGPYIAAGGATVTLVGGPAAPDTSYQWDLGDGRSASGAAVTHAYADNGVYVAKLTTQVNQPGGATTRHFAQVRVTNVPPQVDAGPPLLVDEGQEVDFIATFTDAEWKDTHTAVFYFGDDSPPVIATVSETNSPPQAQGTATARHAYCDDGEYTATVIVRDDDGGFTADTRRVTVRNVAPKVESGEDMFAYPCAPITLVATFTDPGWCDTHTGSWEFGDCTPPRAAIIRERHEPPQGAGIAAASHTYHRCGAFNAVCTVVDDDGGRSSDAVVVRVVDVGNRDFEGGFRNRLVGAVANEWEPYANGAAADPASQSVENPRFAADEFIVHGGQRSQRIGGGGPFSAGIYQQIGSNRGWDYQVSVWHHLDERAGGRCRLGVDPAGGIDPASSNVVWSEGSEHKQWAQLAVRVTATERLITIFLEAASDRGGAAAYFDDVELIPYPCPLKEKELAPPPREESACVDWKEEREPGEIGPRHEKNGFFFESLAEQSLRIVIWGPPPNQGKLLIPRRGVKVRLPFSADRVVAHVVAHGGEPIMLEALDRDGNSAGHCEATLMPGVIQTLEVKSAGMTELRFTGGSGEGVVVDLCIYRLK